MASGVRRDLTPAAPVRVPSDEESGALAARGRTGGRPAGWEETERALESAVNGRGSTAPRRTSDDAVLPERRLTRRQSRAFPRPAAFPRRCGSTTRRVCCHGGRDSSGSPDRRGVRTPSGSRRGRASTRSDANCRSERTSPHPSLAPSLGRNLARRLASRSVRSRKHDVWAACQSTQQQATVGTSRTPAKRPSSRNGPRAPGAESGARVNARPSADASGSRTTGTPLPVLRRGQRGSRRWPEWRRPRSRRVWRARSSR